MQSDMVFEVYEDKEKKEWTWQLRFRNRVQIAKGALKYKSREELRGLIDLVKEQAKDAPIIYV